MRKCALNCLKICLSILFLISCNKKSWDDYYGRPDYLADPIYSILQTKGNYTTLLSVIDKAGYKSTLNASGYWTFFAADDDAFKTYFKSKGLGGVDALDSAACRELITYNLIYYAYKKENIGDYQANTGWVNDVAFRRRTANYTGVYDAKDNTGKTLKAIANNRNGSVAYVNGDNNYKYITYFVEDFMSAQGLSSSDYNYFFPSSTYSGFNVLDASVKESDILAENGVIHIVDKVLESKPSLDQFLNTAPNYSLFNSLYQKYLVNYVANPIVTQNYNLTHNVNDQVFTKVYSSNLAYNLNNESYLIPPGNDAQQGCYTLFAPTNEVLKAYIDTVLLAHYNSLDEMPPTIISDLLNAHMWQVPVWPSRFNITYNYVNEEARFDASANIVDKQLLSNAIFYGTNKVQDANVFASVYGKPYLNPEYSMMVSLLNLELKPSVSSIYNNFTIFMISNKMFNDAGYYADPTVSNVIADQWRFTPPSGSTVVASTGSTTRARLQRILNLSVIPNIILNDLQGAGVAMSYGGEYIKYNGNTIEAAGNVDGNKVLNSLNSQNAKNGIVYYTDNILKFSENEVGTDIELLGTPTSSPFNYFWQYLKNSTALWNNTTKIITGLNSGSFYTIFIPTNQAILNAVNNGLLPGTGNANNMVPNFNPTLELDKAKVQRFIQYHILDKRSVGTDGVESGAFPTILKNNLGESTSIFVTNQVGNLQLSDMSSRTVNTILANSNYLSNRCIIHLIDNYLEYIY